LSEKPPYNDTTAHRAHAFDSLFLDSERAASDFSLFPRSSDPSVPHNIQGLVSERLVHERLRKLRQLDVDEYVLATVAPAENPSRPGIRDAIDELRWPVTREISRGPLYAVEVLLTIAGEQRKVGLLAQDRTHNNGAWLPEQHVQAVQIVREFALQLTPIVTFIDTPGAMADADSNRSNQAHAISRLIAEMAQLHVPTVGIIYGNGYSGGAIPLATTNILLSVVDGVFNTIQPRALAHIARHHNLSWQECAKAVGVSAYELHAQGYLDGVIDYTPLAGKRGIDHLERAIASSIEAIEDLGSHCADTNDGLFAHYGRSVRRFVAPTGRVKALSARQALSTIDNPTQQPNIYGVAYRHLRYLGLRKRIRFTTVKTYGRVSRVELPAGDLEKRIEREHRQAFLHWLENPLKIKYDDAINHAWAKFQEQLVALTRDRGAVASFFLGTRESNFAAARETLLLELCFHVYNAWKSRSSAHLRLLIDHLERTGDAPIRTQGDLNILDLLLHPALRKAFVRECHLLMLFDAVYDHLLAQLKSVAFEAMETNQISYESVRALMTASVAHVMAGGVPIPGPSDSGADQTLPDRFSVWLRRLVAYRRRNELMKLVAEWKKAASPSVSEPLFGLITFFFDRLLPSYYYAERGSRYDGRIRPRNIGIKDFWNRLDRAYKDLLIQEILTRTKRRDMIAPARILDTFFTDVEELDSDMMTADPAAFPGFRAAIERALENGTVPCGTVSALASVRTQGASTQRVGVLVSNLTFQAGSFDMASGVKVCRLLVRCAEQHVPVVCFVSSGGMQTKEGAGALFSMAIVNDRITRFVRDTGLPILVFGFGDCTGGAQASLVTHPLVETFYFSGTSMPFAGRIVVPSHLPTTSTLSNYLSEVDGAMEGLVTHPFAADLDGALLAVDPDMPLPRLHVADVIASVVQGKSPRPADTAPAQPPRALKIFRPVAKVLIHARGCTATKLIAAAHEHDVRVVLVQSDPDMESAAARHLMPSDALVCLGGSTPDESYLNAHSVIRIAEAEGCDALHPGIGFLSESSAFADLCSRHGLNFIGPDVPSMEQTGNKSNAVRTARRLGIPVVPGSHGVVTGPEAAAGIAEAIGYPVVLKAVHGGGGRGIAIVDSPDDLHDTFLRMGAEAQSAFGNRDLYIEKLVVRFRHVEIQILRDRYGHTHVLGLRDCSVQRKQQKVIEESGSTLLTDALRDAAFAHARALADDVGYVGAGTVEFIFDLDAQQIYFMEMNARLQVEHPVTEATTDIDIVREQFRIASGESLESLVVAEQGYAIELRINAERFVPDPEHILRIVPDPGVATACALPQTANIRVVSAVEAGDRISPFYDNLVAQVIAHGSSRDAVIASLLEWLDGARIEGIGTNIPLLKRILLDDEFVEGRHDTGYVARLFERLDIHALVEEVGALRGTRHALARSSIQIEGGTELKVVAPGSCIFYAAPGPNRAEFVTVGTRIRTDTTLCLTEAMKLYEELSLGTFNRDDILYPTDLEYEVVRVQAHDGQLVTEGDLLFVVRPR
jgi:acetyl/propionyl-CoA carboxylase alpha subunit